MARLEHAVLQGPPREMFNDDMEEDKWRRIVDHEGVVGARQIEGCWRDARGDSPGQIGRSDATVSR